MRPPFLLFLVGFMGSGKSTVGPLIAKQLGWEFRDLDAMIERRERKTVAAIFESEGEAAFRAYESAALKQCIDPASASSVVALGGGAFSRAPNRELIAGSGALVAWLDAPVEDLLRRCREQQSGPIRPLLQDESLFLRLYQQRRPDYETATRRFETRDLSPTQVADAVVEWINTSTRSART